MFLKDYVREFSNPEDLFNSVQSIPAFSKQITKSEWGVMKDVSLFMDILDISVNCKVLL